jgi:hypothetical protein
LSFPLCLLISETLISDIPSVVLWLCRIDQFQTVKHRMWRGQATLLLPFLDDLRLSACRHLTRTYGQQWPLRWQRPESSEELEAVANDPLACQYGHLVNLLGTCRAFYSERGWLPVLAHARWVRNELAHNRPIGFGEYHGLFIEARRIGEVFPN